MSPQETPRLPGCPQSPKRSATAERNAAARPTRKSQAQTCCHLNECCISEEVAAGICESPIEMGNDGLAAPGITHRHPPAARLCRGGVSFGTLESRPPVGTPRRQPGEPDRRQFVERFPERLIGSRMAGHHGRDGGYVSPA